MSIGLAARRPVVSPVGMAQRRARGAGGKAGADATREALIAAGIELFGREGLDGPSLDAICARAGYTRGAFYVHFRDREDLLVAVMDRVGWAFLEQVFPSDRENEDLAAAVLRFVEAMASGSYPLTRPGGVRPHQLLQACARSPRIRERYVALVAASIERVEGLVGQGQQNGLCRADVRAQDVARWLLATVIGAQSMLELGVPLDAPGLAWSVMRCLAAPGR